MTFSLRQLFLVCLTALLALPAFAASPATSRLTSGAIATELGRLELDVRAAASPQPGVERDARRQATERRQLQQRTIELRAIARHHGLEAAEWARRWQTLDTALGIQRASAEDAASSSSAVAPATQGEVFATIRARLHRADTGAEIGGSLRVIQVATGNEYVAYSEGDGEVTVDLPAGSYHVQAHPNYPHADLLPEVFEDVYCGIYAFPQECDLSQATVITVAAGQTRSLEFELETQGRIEGTVRDARTQAPIALANVNALDATFGTAASAYAVDGVYSIGVPPGSYYVKVQPDGDYLGQAYPGVPCMLTYSTCAAAGALPIQMLGRQTVAGIDFALIRGARLGGKAVDGSTGQPIADVQVYLIPEDGQIVRVDYTGSDGTWEIGGIPAGRYQLTADASGYVRQFWQGLDCPELFCHETAAWITTVAESVQNGFDFRLSRLGSILGRVADDQNASGVALGVVTAYALRAGELQVVVAVTADSAGAFRLSGLAPGDYYLKAEHTDYRPEVYDDVPVADFERDPTLARKVHVAAGMATDGLDLRLTRLGTIEGRLLDDTTGLPLAYCDVYLWRADAPHQAIRRDGFCADGKFSIGSLEAGEYYLGARGDHASYAPTLLGVGACFFGLDSNHCPLAQATKITLAQGASSGGWELRLQPGATISTRLIAGDGAVVGRIIVHLVDAQDRVISGYNSDFDGDDLFDLRNLPPGDYWLAALGAPHNANHLYPTGTCSRWYCDARQGQKLTVALGQQLTTQPLTIDGASPYQGCHAGDGVLCLEQGRFRVEAFWQDYIGQSGAAQAQHLTDDSGYFTFFGPNNIEIVVKVLNACQRNLGHRFWVFASGLTNVGVQLRITDTLTGEVYEQRNTLGTPYPPLLDTAAFATCDAPEPPPAPGAAESSVAALDPLPAAPEPPPAPAADVEAGDPCIPGLAEICLADRRFRVVTRYGFGGVADQLAIPARISEDAGYVTFFSANNVEVLFKVLDACERYGHFWVFATGLTDVFSTIEVQDTHTGQTKTYGGFEGAFQPIIDTTTFACN